jgi:ketosteroid isomerase-like protein
MGENLELVRDALESFMRGEVERALAFADPDVVCFRAPPLPDPQTYHGVDGVLQMYADWTADFDDFEMEPLEFIEAGHHVFVDVVQRGTGKTSGAAVDGRFWLAYTVADGKITRQDAFLTKELALEALGPPP